MEAAECGEGGAERVQLLRVKRRRNGATAEEISEQHVLVVLGCMNCLL